MAEIIVAALLIIGFLLINISTDNKNITQVRHAVRKGPKFAYPNGVRSKYEKSVLIVFSGVAKLQTAP